MAKTKNGADKRGSAGGGGAKGRGLWLRRGLCAAAAAVCVCLAAFSLYKIFSINKMYADADSEYARLRERERYSSQASSALGGPSQARPPAQSSAPSSEAEDLRPLWEINPDYAGWISIADTAVDYPVVRGADNDKYLNTSFEGAASAVGAIFMDFRNTQGFGGSHTILYGHNMKNGSMFGGLYRYTDAAYLAQHPAVTVTGPDGAAHTYTVFAARRTTATDPAYRTDFADGADFAAFAASIGAPAGTVRLLTLSTCTTGGSDDERVMLHAAITG